MKLPNVWVVEGEAGPAGASFAGFDLRIEPAGWTLGDAQEPSVERLWPWEAMGGLEVVRNAGRTPDGRPATLLELIVNGWPVRVLVPTHDLPNQTVAMLGAFAPLGHPLRVSLRVKRATAWERLSAAGRARVRSRLRGSPVFLRSPSASGLRSALVVVLVLVATVVAASIAGVATSAPPSAGNDRLAGGGSDAVPVGSTTSQASSTSQAPSTAPPTSNSPAVAASSGAPASSSTAVKATTTSVKSSSTTKPKTVTKSSSTTKPTATTKPATTAGSSVTTGPSSTTGPSPTTSAAPTTTTTRVQRPPPTTTTFPRNPSTTRVTRPRPIPTTAPPTTGVTITIPLP